MKLKERLEELNGWEQEFTLGIIESERLTAHECTLSQKQFARLQQISMDLRKRKAPGTAHAKIR
jgi:hypothetical protein